MRERAVYIGSISVWDTTGTLAPICIEIVGLFPPVVRCVMGRKAPRKRLVCRVMCTPHGCSAEHPNVSRRSAHPSLPGERSKVAKPGRRHAPRERDGLFGIVRWELPKPVRQRAASLPSSSRGARAPSALARAHRLRSWRAAQPQKKSPGGFAPPGVVSSARHASIKERCRGGRGPAVRSCLGSGPGTRRSAWRYWS